MWYVVSVKGQLLQQILERPDDVALRRVVADRLVEAGDPRGTFISVQCELADGPVSDERRAELERLERELLEKHGTSWLPPVPSFNEVRFVRGFVEEWRCGADDVIARGNRVAAKTPLRRIVLDTMSVPQLSHLARLRCFRELRELEFTAPGPAIDALPSCRFERLRFLSVSGQDGVSDGFLEAVLEASWWPRLLEVELHRTGTYLDALKATKAPLAPIVALDVRVKDTSALPELRRLERLRELTLHVHRIEGWAERLEVPPSVRLLRLSGATIDRPLLERLHASSTEAIELINGVILGEEVASRLIKAPADPRPAPPIRWHSRFTLQHRANEPHLPPRVAPKTSWFARLFGR